MNKRTLGRTGIEVSEISFGGVEIGRPYGIGVESEADMPSENDAVELLYAALDKGVNFFDTANAYGKSESIIGSAFAGCRDKAVICTKCLALVDDDGRMMPAGEIINAVNGSFEQSLRNLRTDYLDVYMVHSANMEVLENEEVREVFTRLKQKGAARSIGVSVYTPEETTKAIESGIWDVIQLPIHLMDQRTSEAFALAREHGFAIVARSVLFKGILTDRGRDLHPALSAVNEHRNKYNEMLEETGWTLSDLAVKFALSFAEMSSVLVGIDRMEYLEKAVEVADGNYLNDSQMAKLKILQYPEPDFLDLTDWRIKGWLKGN